MKNIYDLKLHEATKINVEYPDSSTDNIPWDILRVSGGWLYNETFVPYNAEFKQIMESEIVINYPTGKNENMYSIGSLLPLKKFKPFAKFNDPIFGTEIKRITFNGEKFDTYVLGGFFSNSEPCRFSQDNNFFLAQTNLTEFGNIITCLYSGIKN